MAYKMVIHKKDGYISVITEGDLHLKEIAKIGEDFVKKETEIGVNRVLIDTRKSRIKARLIDAVFFTGYSDVPVIPGEKNALLIAENSPDMQKIKIYVKESEKKGLEMKIFFNQQEAIDWLLL